MIETLNQGRNQSRQASRPDAKTVNVKADAGRNTMGAPLAPSRSELVANVDNPERGARSRQSYNPQNRSRSPLEALPNMDSSLNNQNQETNPDVEESGSGSSYYDSEEESEEYDNGAS